ncbi:hypothetical protein FOXYSP1_12597 [Fusarium oxysporum f. sp. phaseoli]
MGEQTGSRIFYELWSYVLDRLANCAHDDTQLCPQASL